MASRQPSGSRGCSAASMRQGLGGAPVDLLIADIPYGWKSAWAGSNAPGQGSFPAWRMLAALHPLLPAGCLLAIAADKQQKIAHPGYQRVSQFQVGKRRVTFILNY